VLPPGQYGGQSPTANSTDQVPLYDGLTPLFDQIGSADIGRYFKSERFGKPSGGSTERPRPGLRIRTDRWGVPHVYGRTRSDVMFGAGWVTARDRETLIEQVRGPSRISALDIPGLDAFDVATSLGSGFIPSAQTESFLKSQEKLFRRRGKKGRRVLADVTAYCAGINAYYDEIDSTNRPWTRRDVIAAASLFGAVFGKGGGNEVRSAELLAELQAGLGATEGERVWRDLRETDDPEAPVTLAKRFPYELNPTGPAPGSAVIDAGSLSPTAARAADVAQSSQRDMSNALLVGAGRSSTGRPFAVMGPQVGHAYPGLLMELDLHGGGIDARGASFPSVSMYVLLGRARDYAWSATSSGSDNIDLFLEELCPGGYIYKGRCRPFTNFFAGTLRELGKPDRPISFQQSVHGPITGNVTVGGKPFAVAIKRSTRGRDALSALAFADLNANKVRSARDFARVMHQIEFTFNWHYVDNRDIAFFSSGRLPLRAKGTNPSLPTLGNGRYEWRGFLSRKAHPQAVNPRSGLILNWNNKPAPGFDAADNEYSYGSVHRQELFRGFGRKVRLEQLVAIMNRAATQDLRATDVWPLVNEVLATGPAPDALSRQAADLVSAWWAAGASRLDRDNDGKVDYPGAAVLDAAWEPIANAVLRPTLGPIVDDGGALRAMITRDDHPRADSSAFGSGWYGYVEKDLRSLLGKPVKGPFSRRYCGGGDLAACRADLWTAVKNAADMLAAAQGTDPNAWRSDAGPERIEFGPLLPGLSMRWSNRPTFQQVIEFRGHRRRR
jgi:acyl-homoserine lactone acylase PvdQ